MIKKKEVKITNIIDTNLEDKIIIERVDGGYILTEYQEDEVIVNDEVKEVYREVKSVVEDSINEIQDSLEYDEISDDNRKKITSDEAGLYRLFLLLKEKYGIFYSEHKPVNLVVGFQEDHRSKPCEIEKLKKIRKSIIELSEQAINSVLHAESETNEQIKDEEKELIYKKECEVLKMIDNLIEE